MRVMKGCRRNSSSQYVAEVRLSETRCHYQTTQFCVCACVCVCDSVTNLSQVISRGNEGVSAMTFHLH